MDARLMEVVADIYEALEQVREWTPVYLAVLRHTGDKRQAALAVQYCSRVAQEIEDERVTVVRPHAMSTRENKTGA